MKSWQLLAILHVYCTCSLFVKQSDVDDDELDKPDNRALIKDTTSFGVRDPAGCVAVNGSFETRNGTLPVEVFKSILSPDQRPPREGGQASCRAENEGKPWCPKPEGDNAKFEINEIPGYAAVRKYLQSELSGIDKSMPLVFGVWGPHSTIKRGSAHDAQLLNFMCGWDRLGLENRSVVFSISTELPSVAKPHVPNIPVVSHPELITFMDALARRTNLNQQVYRNRLWKLGAAILLLDLGHDVILSDFDVYWLRDPSAAFVEEAAKSGMEFAASQDCCAHDINSGFLYYRNTAQTRQMLTTALSTWRDVCAGNDQYLLNCGFMRAAVGGLNYLALPKTAFLQCTAEPNHGCHSSPAKPIVSQPSYIGDGLPYTWHTAGMTGEYTAEFDMLEALDLVDLDARTGQCKKGRRGSLADTQNIMKAWDRSCYTGEGGIVHAQCNGACKPEPSRALEFVHKLSTRLHIDAIEASRRPSVATHHVEGHDEASSPSVTRHHVEGPTHDSAFEAARRRAGLQGKLVGKLLHGIGKLVGN